MNNNPEYKRIYKSHSNFFPVEQPKYPGSLEEYIRIYRKSVDNNRNDEYLKKFISNEIKLNYKIEVVEKKLLLDDEYIDLFNMDYSTLCKQWMEEEEQKKMENKEPKYVTLHYSPAGFDEEQLYTVSTSSSYDVPNKDTESSRTVIKPDGTLETHITLELNNF